MRRYLASLLGLAVLSFAGTASAEVLQRYSTGSWSIEANADNGTFQNCTATGSYRGGASVLFMLTRGLIWGVVITNPAWNWRVGSEGNVTYRVDSFGTRSGRARALASNRLLIPLADSQQLFQEIRGGNTMYFQPQGAGSFSITLVGTSVALNELINCVRRYR
jgi:hypothetical protein